LKQIVTKTLIVALIFSLLVFPTIAAQQSSQVISSHGTIQVGGTLGWLHVDGRWIKDESNNTISFTGTTEAQTDWRYPTHEHWSDLSGPVPMAEKMAELGVTWVRVCVDYEFWADPTIGPAYRDLIDRYVNEFTLRNVYCVVGLMSHHLKDDQATWLNFLTELANRYKNNSGMCGIFIFNEPPFPPFTYDIWHQWAVLGAQAVHDANPNLLIVVEVGIGNRDGLDSYWASNPIQLPNIIYAYHNYFWQCFYYDNRDFALNYEAGNYALAKQQMEDYFYDNYFKYAVEYDMCIMDEEFGFNDNVGASPEDMGYSPGFPQCMHDFLEIHNKYGIPWNEYAWHMGGYGLSDGTDINNVGEIWVQYLNPPVPSG